MKNKGMNRIAMDTHKTYCTKLLIAEVADLRSKFARHLSLEKHLNFYHDSNGVCV